MSRRKKAKIGKSRKSRRSSKMGAINFMEPIGLIAGAIAGNFIKKTLSDKVTFGGKDYSGLVVLGAGIFLPKFVKSPTMKSIANGMIVSGGVSAIGTFIPQIPINGIDMIGTDSVNVIGAIDEIGAYRTPEGTVVDESENIYSY